VVNASTERIAHYKPNRLQRGVAAPNLAQSQIQIAVILVHWRGYKFHSILTKTLFYLGIYRIEIAYKDIGGELGPMRPVRAGIHSKYGRGICGQSR
jgi:hypothetical protein